MGRQIMIVGNGDIDPALAGTIDAADLVMRFNDCRSAGHGGTRTDIVTVCNTGRPGKKMLEEPGWKENGCVAAAGEIWAIRDPAKFAAMRAPLAISHPELDDFCDDYTPGFAEFCEAANKRFHIVPAATHESVDSDLSAFDPPPYVVPSTGLIAIAEMMRLGEPDDHITLAGFGHQGWEWHPWEAESKWVERQIKAGRFSRLGAVATVGETPYIRARM